MSAADGEAVSNKMAQGEIQYVPVDRLGSYHTDPTYLKKHIDAILKLPLVDVASTSRQTV